MRLPTTLALVAGLSVGSPLTAQDRGERPPDPQEEARILREASSLEWQGDLAASVRLIEGLLDRKPTSSGGLFALERVLRAADRVEHVLPRVDRFLQDDPGAAGPRYMKLRVLVEIDSLEALPEAAEAWFRAEPDSPDPYREVARLYERALGQEEALAILRRGRDAVEGDDVLALETGDALAALGRPEEAAREWARALSDPEADPETILRRLERVEGVRPEVAEPVIEALLDGSAEPGRRLAAVRAALRHGDHEWTREVAMRGREGLVGEDARGYLEDVADVAREGGAPSVTYWALEGLRQESGDEVPASLEVRLASAALAAGDTVAALAARTRLARALPVGSVERRRVVADLIRVEATRADPETLRTRLQGFRSEFPDAPEADDLAAAVASGLAARGLSDAALEVTDDVSGPRSRLERAWLLFGEGDLEGGRAALEASLPALAPTRSTEVIQLLARMDRVGPLAGRALAVAAGFEHGGRADEGLARLEAVLDSVPATDRAPLRQRAAELARVTGDEVRSQAHLRALLDESPDSPEVPEAMLGLARSLMAAGEVAEARTLLESLIQERPQAAVVPAARRELQKIGRGG